MPAKIPSSEVIENPPPTRAWISFFAHFFSPTLRTPAGPLSAPLAGLLQGRTRSWALPFAAAGGMYVAGAAAFAAWAGARGRGCFGPGRASVGLGLARGVVMASHTLFTRAVHCTGPVRGTTRRPARRCVHDRYSNILVYLSSTYKSKVSESTNLGLKNCFYICAHWQQWQALRSRRNVPIWGMQS